MSESKKLPFVVSNLKTEYKSLIDDFRCGNENIDYFIRENSFKNQDSGKGVTYLVLNKDRNKLIGYYTLAATSLLYSVEEAGGELQIKGWPAIEIKMLAVSKAYSGYKPLGSDNLISDIIIGAIIGDVYTLALETLGIQFIVLQSTANAIGFYERNNFEKMDEYMSLYSEFTEECTPMYMRLFE